MIRALTDQPLPEQMVARVAERVKWSKHEAKVGPWTLRVHPGTRWWDWTVNVDAVFGFSSKKSEKIVVQVGDASSEEKAMKAAAEWFAGHLLSACDAVGVIAKLAADPSKEPRRTPTRVSRK